MGITLRATDKTRTPKIILAVLVATIIVGALGYIVVAKLSKLTQSPQEEIDQLTAKISAFYTLPQGETPTIRSIDSPELVRGQAFFFDTAQGDKLLIYKNAKTAILYRPKENKVIGSTAIKDKAEATSSPTVAGASTKKWTATILNGTNVAGLAKTYQEALEKRLSNVEIVTVSDAKTKGVTKSYMASNKKINNPQEVSKNLGLEIQELPTGEEITTDIVIVLGEDIIKQ